MGLVIKKTFQSQFKFQGDESHHSDFNFRVTILEEFLKLNCNRYWTLPDYCTLWRRWNVMAKYTAGCNNFEMTFHLPIPASRETVKKVTSIWTWLASSPNSSNSKWSQKKAKWRRWIIAIATGGARNFQKFIEEKMQMLTVKPKVDGCMGCTCRFVSESEEIEDLFHDKCWCQGKRCYLLKFFAVILYLCLWPKYRYRY